MLLWPSVEGDTYIIRYRETLETNTPWEMLTDSLAAEVGTNITTFVHSNRVDCPIGQVFGMLQAPGGGDTVMSMMVTPLSDEARKQLRQARKEARVSALYEQCKLEGRQPFAWELEERPPYPWESTFFGTLESTEQESNFGPESGEPEPPGGGGSGGGGGSATEVTTGFYQVVRIGINLFGMTNGTVLSGEVPLRLEFGNTDTNRLLAAIFLTDTNGDDTIPGSTFPELPYEAADHLSGIWDTTKATNGSYAFQVGVRLTDGTVYLDHPITVTVSNLIWFPDGLDVGGFGIYVGAQTIFTNGEWHLDIYDDQGTHLGDLDGSVDSDGFFSYPGIPGPGFTLDNTDGSGNQNPSTSYTLVMSAGPTGGVPPYPIATNKVFIEPAWNFATRAVVCHMNVFAPVRPGWTDVRQLMDTVWNTVEAFHPNLLGGITAPYEVFTTNDWGNVVMKLRDPSARDFFYFGHGSESSLGTTTNVDLRVSDLKIFLQNNIDNPLTATNRHPFRFVFLDGCNTADGNWPQAFGIPKKEGMVITDFTQTRGIRPRAFMGWNREKPIGTGIISGGSMNLGHMTYVTTFWSKWAERNGSGGPLRDLTAAKTAAETAAPGTGGGMKVYGAKDLVIDN